MTGLGDRMADKEYGISYWDSLPVTAGMAKADLPYRRTSASSKRSFATLRYSRMAVSIFARASAFVFPWDQQPGKPGADTL